MKNKLLLTLFFIVFFVFIIALTTLSILGNKERVGYLTDFKLVEESSSSSNFVYSMRMGYYDTIFQHSDVYILNPIIKPDYITSISFNKYKNPSGEIVSSKKINNDERIDISYKLKVKLDVYMLLFTFTIVSLIIFLFYKYGSVLNVISCKKIKINLSIVMIIGYLYLLIPFLIFIIGWVRPLFSIPCFLILLLVFTFMIKDTLSFYNKVCSFDIFIMFCILIVIVSLVIIGGIGEIFKQEGDFTNGRNAMLRDLINFKWPIIYPENGGAMVFYFAHWLVPAIFGKIFSLTAGNMALIIWTSIGIYIAFLLLLMLLNIEDNKMIIIAFSIFMFFDCLPIRPGGYIFYEPRPTFTISSQLFNQGVATYIMAALFIAQKNAKNFVFIGLLVTLYSAYAILGIIPFMFIKAFLLCKENFVKTLKDIFSKENVLSLISIFPILFLFLSSNNTTTNGGFKFFGNISLNMILWYIVTFLVYAFLIYKDNKKNYLFFICLFVFIATSFIQYMGDHNFNRVNIPSFFIFTFLIIKYFLDNKKSKSIKKYVLIVCLLLSSIRGLIIINNKITWFVSNDFKINKEVGRETVNTKEINWTVLNTTSLSPEKTIFFNYISKKHN